MSHPQVAVTMGDAAGIGPEIIVGALTLAMYRIPTGLKAWIEDVVVDDKARGNGIGDRADPGGRHCQVGSLAGAAHLLKDNAGVLR